MLTPRYATTAVLALEAPSRHLHRPQLLGEWVWLLKPQHVRHRQDPGL